MAILPFLTSHVVSDLTIGKPPFFCLSSSSSLRHALSLLRSQDDPSHSTIAVWDCINPHQNPNPSPNTSPGHNHRLQGSSCCFCVAKVSLQHIICFLASDSNLCNLPAVLDQTLSSLVEDAEKTLSSRNYAASVCHVHPHASDVYFHSHTSCIQFGSLLDALDLMAGGVQNLVVPISHQSSRLRKPLMGLSKPIVAVRSISLDSSHVPPLSNNHNGQEYCWVTQEDMLRFLLGSIGVFDPIPLMHLSELEVIRTDFEMIEVDDDASSALEIIKLACHAMRPVAVVNKSSHNDVGRRPNEAMCTLVGEISYSSMEICNEVAAFALATLSAGDFLVYTQVCENPPETIVDFIRMRVYKKLSDSNGTWHLQQPRTKLNEVNQMLKDLDTRDESGNSSSDDEHSKDRGGFHIAKFKSCMKRSFNGPVFCNPTSSLIAIILQCLAHRKDHAWVLGNDDDNLIGVVTFLDILTVILKHSIR